jgi:hypothetical protein
MILRDLLRTLFVTLLALLIPVAAFAQYPGGTGGGTGTGTGTYNPNGGYKSSTGIAIGVGVAAGATILYLTMHKASVVGCVEPASDGFKLMSERDKNTYALVTNGEDLKPGERVELKGKKAKDEAGDRLFRVQRVAKDLGPCGPAAAATAANLSH